MADSYVWPDGRVMRTPPKGRKPTHQEMAMIKSMLRIGFNHKLPRCGAKDRKKVKKFEANGDFSHSERRHICPDCSCDKTAGLGTYGNFWGPGEAWREVGHYGTGWCRSHSIAFNRKVISDKEAEKHLMAMQNHGLIKYTPQAIEKRMEDEAEEASQSQEVRENLSQLQKLIREMFEHFDNRTALTETAGGKIVPMSDASYAKLVSRMSKDIGSLAKTRFELDALDYVHIDEIKARLPAVHRAACAAMAKVRELTIKGEQSAIEVATNEWLMELKDVFTTVKRGKK